MKKNMFDLFILLCFLSFILGTGGCGGESGGVPAANGESADTEYLPPYVPPTESEDIYPAPESPDIVTPVPEGRRLRVFIDGREFAATLNGTNTAREFAALLPLDMEMNDHLRREKLARLPRNISVTDAPTKPFEAGDITYWAPGQDMAIFYTSNGSSGVYGLHSLGTLTEGWEYLENSGAPVRVRIELVSP